jgi:hypothetical protein
VRYRYEQKRKLNFDVNALPVEERCVRAEVIRYDAPVDICRLAAGQHQAVQSDTLDASTEDVIRMLGMQLTAKLQPPSAEGQLAPMPMLEDKELFQHLLSMGVVKEEKSINLKKKGKTPQECLV